MELNGRNYGFFYIRMVVNHHPSKYVVRCQMAKKFHSHGALLAISHRIVRAGMCLAPDNNRHRDEWHRAAVECRFLFQFATLFHRSHAHRLIQSTFWPLEMAMVQSEAFLRQTIDTQMIVIFRDRSNKLLITYHSQRSPNTSNRLQQPTSIH